MALFRISAFSILAIAICVQNAAAGDFGKRGNTEIISVTHPSVDVDLKNYFARRAKKSIEFMLFSTSKDATGMSFLHAMREAQVKRGVSVTGLYDRQISAMLEGDRFNFVKAMITDPSLECRGEVFCAHPIEKFSSGLSFSEFIHGKIIRIDGGTPDELIFWGGRGMTDKSAYYIDSGYIMRPIKFGEPYAGDDLMKVYESILASMKKLADRSIIRIPSQVNHSNLKIPGDEQVPFAESPAAKIEFTEILDFLKTPPRKTSSDAFKPFVFHPKAVSVFSNDLYEKLLNGTETRKSFESLNHAKVASFLDKFSGTAVLTAYSVSPDTPLHDALVRFVRRGNNLEFVTNGDKAYKTIGTTRGFPAYYTYERVLEIMKASQGPKSGKIDLYLLDPEKAAEVGLSTYVHRKNITYLNKRGIAVVTDDGSDNFTYSAARMNDEILIRTNDERMAERNYRQTLSERKFFNKVDGISELKALYAKRPFWFPCVRALVKANF